MAQPVKTNAMRILDREGITYETIFYDVDDSDLSGQSVARKIGVDEGMMFKTLVLRGEKRGVIICGVPVSGEIDLKRLALAAGDKNVEMVAQKEVLALTGYIRGGVSPVGMKKKYPVFMDETVILYEKIAVSGGQRGCQIILKPDDLIGLLDIETADVTKR